MRVYTVEQGGRKREGGVKSGNRNNSKQTQREKDREGEALQDKQLFYFGGRRLAVKLKWQQTQRESEKVEREKKDPWSLSQTQNQGEECQSLQACWERLQVCLSASSHSLDFRKDAFRLPGQEERWGQSGEQSEARCCSRDGNEDAVCLLLSWFIFSCRGEVYDD